MRLQNMAMTRPIFSVGSFHFCNTPTASSGDTGRSLWCCHARFESSDSRLDSTWASSIAMDFRESRASDGNEGNSCDSIVCALLPGAILRDIKSKRIGQLKRNTQQVDGDFAFKQPRARKPGGNDPINTAESRIMRQILSTTMMINRVASGTDRGGGWAFR